jgi:hypothetical protein
MGSASNENLEDYGKQLEPPQEGTPQAETKPDEECCGEAPAEESAGGGR